MNVINQNPRKSLNMKSSLPFSTIVSSQEDMTTPDRKTTEGNQRLTTESELEAKGTLIKTFEEKFKRRYAVIH